MVPTIALLAAALVRINIGIKRAAVRVRRRMMGSNRLRGRVLGPGTRTSEENHMRKQRPVWIVIVGSRFRTVGISMPVTLRGPHYAVSTTDNKRISQEIQSSTGAGSSSADGRLSGFRKG